MLKRIGRNIPLLVLALFCARFAAAQSGLDVHFGGGYATDKSRGPSDLYGDGELYDTPKLNATFLNFGGDVMFKPKFGIGAQLTFQPGKTDYAGYGMRPMFYDVNAIYQPITGSKRVVPVFQGGLGGVSLRWYDTSSGCNEFTGCSSSTSYLASSSHFQLHGGAGARFYVSEHIYVQPQFDIRWVKNFFQYGSNWVPQYGASVGYHFGEK